MAGSRSFPRPQKYLIINFIFIYKASNKNSTHCVWLGNYTLRSAKPIRDMEIYIRLLIQFYEVWAIHVIL